MLVSSQASNSSTLASNCLRSLGGRLAGPIARFRALLRAVNASWAVGVRASLDAPVRSFMRLAVTAAIAFSSSTDSFGNAPTI